MRRRGMMFVAVLLVVTAVVLTAGCAGDPAQGWSARTIFPTDVSTIALTIIENDTYERDFEFELTDALIKEIEARTPYKVTSADRADMILTGRISSVRRQQLSKSALTGLSEEVTLSVTIDLMWRDLRTGESLLELESFTGDSLFVPSNPTGEPIEIGQFGVAQRLARDIVTEMRSGW